MCFSKNLCFKIGCLFISLFFISSCGRMLQRSGSKNYKPTIEIDKKYNKYQADLLYYNAILEEGFPKINETFSADKRKIALEEAVDKLAGNDTKNIDFIIQTSKYLSNFNNQHTRININAPTEKVFPYVIHIFEEEWYLLNISSDVDSTVIGQKIVSINNQPVTDIQEQLKNYTYAENRTNQIDLIKWYRLYNKPEMLEEIDLIGEVSEAIRLEFENDEYVYLNPTLREEVKMFRVILPGTVITQKNPATYLYKLYPDQNFGYLQFNRCHDKIDIMDGIKSYVKPWLQPMANAYAKRQFKRKKPAERIKQYYNEDYPIFKDFVKELVDTLNQKNIEHLIVDLRYNPGGSVTIGKQLLYYLTDKNDLKGFNEYAYNSEFYKTYFKEEFEELQKNNNTLPKGELILRKKSEDAFYKITDPNSDYYIPKNRNNFKGKVYILADTGTGSAAAILTTLFQDNDIGVVIGRTVSNNPIGASTYTPVSLPKTKASGTIASSYMERPIPSKGKIQQPDYWVEKSIQDLIDGVDPHLKKAMELITKK